MYTLKFISPGIKGEVEKVCSAEHYWCQTTEDCVEVRYYLGDTSDTVFLRPNKEEFTTLYIKNSLGRTIDIKGFPAEA